MSPEEFELRQEEILAPLRDHEIDFGRNFFLLFLFMIIIDGPSEIKQDRGLVAHEFQHYQSSLSVSKELGMDRKKFTVRIKGVLTRNSSEKILLSPSTEFPNLAEATAGDKEKYIRFITIVAGRAINRIKHASTTDLSIVRLSWIFNH